jgi:ankyrin repeat protein
VGGLEGARGGGAATAREGRSRPGLDPDSKDGPWTDLSWAAEKGHEAVVQLLLWNGAELESEEYGGQTPLSLAAWTGQEAVVRLLLEKGADVESKSSRSGTPLSLAA